MAAVAGADTDAAAVADTVRGNVDTSTKSLPALLKNESPKLKPNRDRCCDHRTFK